jgi:hypothetical protein
MILGSSLLRQDPVGKPQWIIGFCTLNSVSDHQFSDVLLDR